MSKQIIAGIYIPWQLKGKICIGKRQFLATVLNRSIYTLSNLNKRANPLLNYHLDNTIIDLVEKLQFFETRRQTSCRLYRRDQVVAEVQDFQVGELLVQDRLGDRLQVVVAQVKADEEKDIKASTPLFQIKLRHNYKYKSCACVHHFEHLCLCAFAFLSMQDI